jgi:hypothetical protein
MSEPTQPASWPNARGPWYEVSDDRRLYDSGWFWCATASGHPDRNGGYPSHERHPLALECRSLSTGFDGVRADLQGPNRGLEVYAAAPFQFGQLRGSDQADPARILLECYTDTSCLRFSLPAGEALRLGRRLAQLVDLITIPPPAATSAV